MFSRSFPPARFHLRRMVVLINDVSLLNDCVQTSVHDPLVVFSMNAGLIQAQVKVFVSPPLCVYVCFKMYSKSLCQNAMLRCSFQHVRSWLHLAPRTWWFLCSCHSLEETWRIGNITHLFSSAWTDASIICVDDRLYTLAHLQVSSCDQFIWARLFTLHP